MKAKFLPFLIATTALAAPAFASGDEAAVSNAVPADLITGIEAPVPATPTIQVPAIRNDDDFALVFTAIQQQRWAEAQAMLANAPAGPLANMARAELYLAAGSPRVELGPLLSLINTAPYLPQAEQLSRLAQKRGAQFLPDTPQVRRLAYLGSSPRRADPSEVSDAAATATRNAIVDRIKADDPAGAETALLAGLGKIVQPGVIENPQSEPDDTHLVYGIRKPLIRVWHDVVSGI